MKIKIKLMVPNTEEIIYVDFPLEYNSLVNLQWALPRPTTLNRTVTNYKIESPQWLDTALGGSRINLMDLDYLSKRLDSFDNNELDTYIAVIEKEKLSDMTDLINLTFSSSQYTLVADVSDLAMVGLKRYLSEYGGIPLSQIDEEHEQLCQAGKELLLCGTGTPTTKGILFPPASPGPMKEYYQEGGIFPQYDWTSDSTTEIEITSAQRMENGKESVVLYLPLSQLQQADTLHRMGLTDPSEIIVISVNSKYGKEIDFQGENFHDINEFVGLLQNMTSHSRKLVPQIAERTGEANDLTHNINIASHLHDLLYIPTVTTAEEYGRWLIFESGKFDYSDALKHEGLDLYINYGQIGEDYARMENGTFTENGYLGFKDPDLAFLFEQQVDEPCQTEEQSM